MAKKRPTVEELEDILSGETEFPVEILESGEIVRADRDAEQAKRLPFWWQLHGPSADKAFKMFIGSAIVFAWIAAFWWGKIEMAAALGPMAGWVVNSLFRRPS